MQKWGSPVSALCGGCGCGPCTVPALTSGAPRQEPWVLRVEQPEPQLQVETGRLAVPEEGLGALSCWVSGRFLPSPGAWVSRW